MIKIILSIMLIFVLSDCATQSTNVSPNNSDIQGTAVVAISNQDYGNYSNGIWLWRTELNNSASSALGLYKEYQNQSISLDDFHNKMFNLMSNIESIKSTFTKTVPKGYKTFDKASKRLANEEEKVLTDFEVTNGDNLDKDASKIKALIDQINSLNKTLPMPEKS